LSSSVESMDRIFPPLIEMASWMLKSLSTATIFPFNRTRSAFSPVFEPHP